MKAWTIAAAAAGLMSLGLISSPASADSRDHWRGDWRGSSYSRHDDCNDHRRHSRNHRQHDGDRYDHRGNDSRWSWNDRGRDRRDWRDGDHRRRDHDGDRRDRRYDYR